MNVLLSRTPLSLAVGFFSFPFLSLSLSFFFFFFSYGVIIVACPTLVN